MTIQGHSSEANAHPEQPLLRQRDVLAIAVPITLSNATVPLIGFVDATVIGQLGQAHLLGAVALAATVFNFMYFAFNFLRMGTTGLTAQAVGADNQPEIAASLARALLMAAAIGLGLIVLQAPITSLALNLLGASDRVSDPAATYIEIRIWAAPAGLANFALLGWFIGLSRADIAFYLQLLLNGINIALSLLFVMSFEWGVPGVAAAALIADYAAAVVGLFLAANELSRRSATTNVQAILQVSQLRRVFAVSRDIFIRTLSVQIAITFFVAQGARSGDVTLATNAVLFNLVLITIYMIDGFAYAVETLVGQSVGAGRRQRFRDAIRLSTIGAVVVSLVLSVGLWLLGAWIIDFMTTSTEVREASRIYLVWAAILPLTSIWCFILDGIFIGATATATMRNMMIVSMIAYFAAWAVFEPIWQNHGLWLSLHVLFIVRAVTLAYALPSLERQLFERSIKVEH
ncbi:MAG: MATE family efflux transporter [Pseudomonadota bacterium]